MIPITQSYTETASNGKITIYPKSTWEFLIINDAFSLSSKYIKFQLALKSTIDNSRITLKTLEIKEEGTKDGYTNQAAYDTWQTDYNTKNASLNSKMLELTNKSVARQDELDQEIPDQAVIDALDVEIATLNSEISTLTTEVNTLAANPVTLIPNMIDQFDDFFSTYIDSYDVTPAGAAYLASKVGVSIT